MNKDQVKGAVKDAAGKLQEQIGKATGSRKQQAKGLAKHASGKVQKAYGDVKRALKDAEQPSGAAVDERRSSGRPLPHQQRGPS